MLKQRKYCEAEQDRSLQTDKINMEKEPEELNTESWLAVSWSKSGREADRHDSWNENVEGW